MDFSGPQKSSGCGTPFSRCTVLGRRPVYIRSYPDEFDAMWNGRACDYLLAAVDFATMVGETHWITAGPQSKSKHFCVSHTQIFAGERDAVLCCTSHPGLRCWRRPSSGKVRKDNASIDYPDIESSLGQYMAAAQARCRRRPRLVQWLPSLMPRTVCLL